MVIPSKFRRAFLRNLYREAVAASQTLENALLTVMDSRVGETDSGRFLLNSAANGHSVGYSVPTISFAGNIFTPVDVVMMISDLVDLYYASYSNLGGTPTDAQVLTEMLDRIHPITASKTRFTSLRYSSFDGGQ